MNHQHSDTTHHRATGHHGHPTKVTVLDGGTGRELKRIGAPFRQPEWSALALIEAPDAVTAVHRGFVDAGAEVITTNAYALVPFHIGEERFARDGARLAALAAQLARAVADEYGAAVAGALPPALGSYRAGAFDPDAAYDILTVLAAAQAPSVDVWLSETVSLIAEARVGADVVAAHGAGRPWWVSFTLADHLSATPSGDRARLRSGESITDAVATAISLGAELVGFNCSPPEVMETAVREARAVDPDIPLAVYANAFDLGGSTQEEGTGANSALHGVRSNFDGLSYDDLAVRWVAAGATAVGGCCGITSEQIRGVADRFRSDGLAPLPGIAGNRDDADR